MTGVKYKMLSWCRRTCFSRAGVNRLCWCTLGTRTLEWYLVHVTPNEEMLGADMGQGVGNVPLCNKSI